MLIVVDHPSRFDGGNEAEFGARAASPLVRGMYVNVRLQIRPQKPLVAIPSLAIQPGNRVWQFIPDDSAIESGQPLPAAETRDGGGDDPATLCQRRRGADAGAAGAAARCLPMSRAGAAGSMPAIGRPGGWSCGVT